MSRSWIITKGRYDYGHGRSKSHPVTQGKVLLEEFIKPMKLSQNRLAIEIGVDARRINEITLGTRSVTADTALRLGRYLASLRNSGSVFKQKYDFGCRQG